LHWKEVSFLALKLKRAVVVAVPVVEAATLEAVAATLGAVVAVPVVEAATLGAVAATPVVAAMLAEVAAMLGLVAAMLVVAGTPAAVLGLVVPTLAVAAAVARRAVLVAGRVAVALGPPLHHPVPQLTPHAHSSNRTANGWACLVRHSVLLVSAP
jgi:hypothetical protein